MLIMGGAFVLEKAGATPKRRKGLARRSARGLRAGQSDKWDFQGSWEPERSGDRLPGGQPREG